MVKLYAGTVPDLNTIPFQDMTYTQKVYDPNTISFKSTKYLKQGTDLRLLGNFIAFGGKIKSQPEGQGIYSYEANDYSDLLRGKIKASFENKTSSTIIKTILKNRNLRTGGINKTTKKHDSLIFKDVRALDLCHQVANLEKNYREFYVNANGIGIFKKIPSEYKGLVLRPGQYADYNLSIDSSNIITGVKVYGKKDSKSLLYSYNNKTLSAKYGVITELIIDDNIKTKARAKAKAKKLFKTDGHAEIEAVFTIPAIAEYKYLKPGDYLILYYTPTKFKKLWIEEITNTLTKRELKLLSSKLPEPENWTYKSPSTNDTGCTTVKGVSPPKKVRGSCNYCNYLPTEKNTFENKCPLCGKKGKLKFNYGHTGRNKYNYINQGADYAQFTCDPNTGGCGADFCAKCGSEKERKKRGTLKKVSSKTKCSVKGVAKTIVKFVKDNNLNSPCKIFKWVDKYIIYEFYLDGKKSNYRTFTQRKGNCVDQSQLLIAMLKCINISATMNKTTCPFNGRMVGHANVTAKVHGRNIIMDPASPKPANRKKGSWVSGSGC